MAGQPRRILVTGAAGFVGRHLRPALETAFPDAELLTDRFDVTEAGAAAAAIAAAKPDAVVHLAAVAAPTDARRDPDKAWRVNLGGTLTLARAVLAHAPEAVFLYAGSADAYGNSFRGGAPVTEDTALAPLNTYGATKGAADLAVGAMVSDGLRAIRVRPFNHTGPGQGDALVVPAFAHQVMRIKAGRQAPEMQVGALDPERDFLDVRDVCRGYAACLAAELAPGQVVNLASGQPRRIGDILHALLDLAGVQAEVRTDTGRLRTGDIPRSVGDAGMARRLLGWEPAIPWETTLRDVLDDWGLRVAAES